ncbi:MAG TPA: chemotaxis protein CheA [Terriglobales bacterium]|nr:chemotaxis protein CheA [Terriglobales bacterium]
MSNSSDDRAAELRELFFESAQELLQALNEDALKLEKNPGDAEIVRSIRRTVHTLKGDAAACGYRELSELAHELEDALALELSESAHVEVAELALAAADVFAAMLQAYRHNKKIKPATALQARIHKLAAQPAPKQGRSKKKSAASNLHFAWTEYERLAIKTALAQGRTVYQVSAVIDPQCAMPVAGRQLIQNALKAAGELLAIRPEPGATRDMARTVEAALVSQLSAQQIQAGCRIPSIVSKVVVESLAPKKGAKTPAKAAEGAAAPQTPADQIAETPAVAEADALPEKPEAQAAPVPVAGITSMENTLRVDAERIDNVLNLVGELIIGKSMLHQTLNEFGRRYPKDSLRNKFSDAMAFQARVLNDLQRAVMKIRMVPVEQLFRRFPRVVRDVARQCGKEVELVLSGQDTDLDKSILDAIGEPLTHMVRNAVSHGIETAEERTRAGKPAKGTIKLDAYHHGNQVIVEVSDDGRGIDCTKIRAKAVELGLAGADEAARMSEAEVLDFIFKPGFSTAEQVTEISGRGVGMDVVHSVLHRMKGSVSIETRLGQGTLFRLKLPLTLAIIKALMFTIEQRLYAIPLNAVAEISRATEAEVHRVDNHEVLQLRNQVLPLVRLGHPPDGQDVLNRKFFVLVISAGEKKMGLIVDGLAGEEELVIKALDDQVVATDLVSGASILGDGRVVLILNLAAIVERISRMRPEDAGGIVSGLLFSHGQYAARKEGPQGSAAVQA